MIIKPTVARNIWYWPHASEVGIVSGNDQPLVAFICHVWNDTTINIAGFDANGVVFSRQRVTLLQEDAKPDPSKGYAQWMPYQVGQAKPKTEETPAAPVKSETPVVTSAVVLPAAVEAAPSAPAPVVATVGADPLAYVRPANVPVSKSKSKAALLKAAVAELESKYGVTFPDIVAAENETDTTAEAST